MTEVGRETSSPSSFLGQPSQDTTIAQCASDQHGVLDLDQLKELGLAASTVRSRAANGRLHRVHQCVFSLMPVRLLTREGRWMAAVLAVGKDAVLSHTSAAVLHELVRSDSTRIDVTVRGRSGRSHDGITVHRSKTVTPADITRVKNIPCTTIARTLLDLADVLNRRRLERAFDQAEIQEALDLIALNDQLARNSTRPATARIRELLAEHYIGSTPTESELEEAFLALCRRAGLPRPEVQQWLHLPDGEPPISVDFLWRAQRVVVETDGDRFHATNQAVRRDARKDQRLTAHGFKPIRTGWRQIFLRPAELEVTLKALVCGVGPHPP